MVKFQFELTNLLKEIFNMKKEFLTLDTLYTNRKRTKVWVLRTIDWKKDIVEYEYDGRRNTCSINKFAGWVAIAVCRGEYL